MYTYMYICTRKSHREREGEREGGRGRERELASSAVLPLVFPHWCRPQILSSC